MKIEITVYKETGKYYTNALVERETPIMLYDDEFKKFIRENLPAKIENGYVVVSNADPDDNNFYEKLYKMNDLC